jgi:tripeptidyl-peptidase I
MNWKTKGVSPAETDLDTQISWPQIWPQNLTVYQVDDRHYAYSELHGLYNTFLDAIDGSYCHFSAYGISGDSPGIDPKYPDDHPHGFQHARQCGVYKPPNVLSFSYGTAEHFYPWRYTKRQCLEYLKLGLQGVSVFFCSQDYGVGGGIGAGPNACLKGKDGKYDVFAPVFPASCPFVTSVGATHVPLKNAGTKKHFDEEGIELSGGGFSNTWTTPKYQKAAVQKFLKNHKPPYKSYETKDTQNIGAGGGKYNRIGRGFPDISAMGDNIPIHDAGFNVLIGGTSAATPLWAAIITRINEERLAVGKGPVGFINPTLVC